MAKLLTTVFLHVRVGIDGGTIDDVAALRDELKALAAKYGETWAVRIKRRVLTKQKADALLDTYAKRAAETARGTTRRRIAKVT